MKFVSDIKTAQNIAYKNSTCESVAKDVRKMLKKTDDYEVGEVLVCRKYLKISSGTKCSVNFEYIIKAVKEGSIVIKELHASTSLELKLDVIRKRFIHSYCRTCHSFQGSSIDGKITIFDWRFFFVNRKWLYTAVTRATELKNFLFHNPKEASADYDEEVLDKTSIRRSIITNSKITLTAEHLLITMLLLTGSSHNSVKRVMDAVIASASKLKMVK